MVAERLIKDGKAKLNQGNIEAAIKDFDLAIRSNPRDPNSYIVLGETYLHLHNYAKAVDTLAAALLLDPNSGQANYMLALAHNFRGENELAIQHAQKSTQIFSDTKDMENFRKSLLLLQGLTQANKSPAKHKI